MATMQALRIHGYGGLEALSLDTVLVPEPGPEDVLIRVLAASVNPLDAVIRAGYMQAWFQHQLPLTLGWDVAGVVEAVGSAVDTLQVGQSVYGRPDTNRDGCYAEYVVARAAELAPQPATLDAIHAAAVPQAAMTAWQSLFDAAGLAAGQTVLIHGAAGGVGTFAVQLAKWRGARVIATASADNLGFLHELGADEVIDYTTTRFEAAVHDVDMVFDLVGANDDTQDRSWAVLKPGGALVSVVTPPDAAKATEHGVRQFFVGMQTNRDQLVELAGLIDAGHIQPIVPTVLPLRDAREAQRLIETRHTRGKIVLHVAD